ncbi:SWIM zinc finger family protein [Mycobacterium ostraviense]|uniref:SWIM zinc finger family protein n=1 Tax=Mycobacterium ostraviense TaxID=2738409 RepID=UPI000AE264AE|nr:SWIM zinc finger family protein [Mycobacterium ostraviense]UGT92070.1 SWIM zinc finger family protein [Mycobacterium ostraviense]
MATLLAGEMPEDIEDVFGTLGLSLFPTTARELSLDCSCPDRAVPCKHLAATFYLLAESFDEDPFAILAWRGREREDLLGQPAGGPVRVPRQPTGPSCRAGPLPSASTPTSSDKRTRTRRARR